MESVRLAWRHEQRPLALSRISRRGRLEGSLEARTSRAIAQRSASACHQPHKEKPPDTRRGCLLLIVFNFSLQTRRRRQKQATPQIRWMD